MIVKKRDEKKHRKNQQFTKNYNNKNNTFEKIDKHHYNQNENIKNYIF